VACRRLPARDHRREVARALGGILSEDVGTDHALLDLATNDVVNQTVRAQHLLFTARGVAEVSSAIALRVSERVGPDGAPFRNATASDTADGTETCSQRRVRFTPPYTNASQIAASASPRITSKRVMTGKPTRKS
jgi:hypothetical protein